jgi:hypothetical protein
LGVCSWREGCYPGFEGVAGQDWVAERQRDQRLDQGEVLEHE